MGRIQTKNETNCYIYKPQRKMIIFFPLQTSSLRVPYLLCNLQIQLDLVPNFQNLATPTRFFCSSILMISFQWCYLTSNSRMHYPCGRTRPCRESTALPWYISEAPNLSLEACFPEDAAVGRQMYHPGSA